VRFLCDTNSAHDDLLGYAFLFEQRSESFDVSIATDEDCLVVYAAINDSYISLAIDT
jgi:hypothetical protein